MVWDELVDSSFFLLLSLQAGVGEKMLRTPLKSYRKLWLSFRVLLALEFSNPRVERSMMTNALRFSTVPLLTHLLILLRQSKGFLLPSGQALCAVGLSPYDRATASPALSPCRSKYLGLQERTQYTTARAAEAATAPAYQRRGVWRTERRVLTMSAGGGSTAGDIDAGGDVREVCACCNTGAILEIRCSTANENTITRDDSVGSSTIFLLIAVNAININNAFTHVSILVLLYCCTSWYV